MKTAVFWIATLMIFGITNGMIAHKEATIRNGTTIHVELAPRDPRSLMQGDYMALRYQLNDVERPVDGRGKFVVRLDENVDGLPGRNRGRSDGRDCDAVGTGWRRDVGGRAAVGNFGR